ncbi:hypothetical protein [Zavarzinella formosa]|nr:hypothetical protein [Zavarzinella formosa]
MKKPESKRLQLLRKIIPETDDALNRDENMTAAGQREPATPTLAALWL